MPSDPLLDFVLSRVQIDTHVCSRQRHENGYILPSRTIPDYNYIWVTRGRVVWVVEGVEHLLTPGELIVVPPQVDHRGYSRTKHVTLGSIHVTASLPGGQDAFDLLTPARQRSVAPTSRLGRYLAMAIDEWDRADASVSLVLQSWARLITLELFRHDAAAGLLTRHEMDPLIAALLDELQRRIDRVTTLDELAAWAGFTPQHLNRTFRRALGVTPLQHLMRLRMDRAAALLKQGLLTVRAVAGAIAIDDPYYFSRVFSEHFGMSPTDYRTAAGSENPS